MFAIFSHRAVGIHIFHQRLSTIFPHEPTQGGTMNKRYSWFYFAIIPLLFLSLTEIAGAQEVYARKAGVPVPAMETGGIGNFISGVDFDGDGKDEVYLVNNNINDTGPGELIPRVYKYEWSGTAWDSVWSAELSIPLQNTWPALTYGDWDKDGKMEIIWGPVNNLNATTNPKPARVIVFEEKGDGSDVMGIASGSNYLPSAKWTITDSSMFNLRPFRWLLSDVDNDGNEELIFCDRASSTTGYRFGVIGVSNIPDNGDGSETWTLEYSGKDSVLTTGSMYDLAVLDSTIYLFPNAATGPVIPVRYRNGVWSIGKAQTGLVAGGSWKSSSVLDVNGDGKKEIVVAGWTSTANNKVFLLQPSGDTLIAAQIADFATLIGTAGQLYGGAVGDFDTDGKPDFVFGSRNATPNAAIVRLSYRGGLITDPASYQKSMMDAEVAAAGRWDEFGITNVDADIEPEILYTSGYGTPEPLTWLDRVALKQVPILIAEARKDSNNDFRPDRLNDTVTVIGVVNSINPTASANRLNYFMQDAAAGINFTKGSLPGGGPVYKIGDRVVVRGVVGQNRGQTQLNVADTLDIVKLASGAAPAPIVLTIDKFLATPETYECRFIKINAVAKTAASPAWPALATDANMLISDGYMEVILRVDQDTDMDGQVEPVWPVNVQGVATQYTSGSTVYNDGYQISPNMYTDFTMNVAAPPERHFAMLAPPNSATVVLNDTAQIVTFRWRAAVDLNKDTLAYSWAPVGKPIVSAARDTFLTRTGKQMLTYLGTADSVLLKWTAAAKDPANPPVFSADTFMVVVKRGTITGLPDENGLPSVFALDQNYPNPFNPTTTIRYGLPMQAAVSLKIYDVLGREVMTLLEETQGAGVQSIVWNGRNSLGAQVSSGMYFYRLEARPADGSRMFVEMKKMMMLK